ncbi:uncharacterized protein LOC135839219 [Planococcus citri]|uniref:uncharacterized protein LOC135839219 n=1 Tax=Planococcus citri TaxID=170843 RepID=UPI0031F96F6C
MKFVCIVFACIIAGVFSDPKCLVNPRNGIYSGACKIRNLTVVNIHNNAIIHERSCKVDNVRQYIPQYIKFHNVTRNVSQSYLLAVVDTTNNKLLGLMSNLTMQSGTIPTSSKINPNIQTIKDWNTRANPRSGNLTVQYLVFEEHRNNPKLNYTADWALKLSPFNLFVWIKSQECSGISICGPVAGGNVVLLPSLESPQTTTAAPKPRPRPKITTTTIKTPNLVIKFEGKKNSNKRKDPKKKNKNV